jgi:hypothetical protein
MRRKITVGITLTAMFALSALASFAYSDPYASSGRPTIGPRIAKVMVARNDVGTGSPLPNTPPAHPGKPIPIDTAVIGPGNTMPGTNMRTGSTPMAVATPQMALEGRLKSLALDLR